MKLTLLLTALIAILSLTLVPADAAAQRVVTAAQVNGTWRSDTGEFKVLALGKQRLKIEFVGVYEYETAEDSMANEGRTSGIAFIEGERAVFTPSDGDGECEIEMIFRDGKLVVTQSGFCGFGHNVSATGTYVRIDKRKPTFEPAHDE